MKAMILAAGQGKRLRPLTNTIPKPLIEVTDQPIILDVIGRLRDFGIDEILINVSHLGDQIISCVETSGTKNVYFIKETFCIILPIPTSPCRTIYAIKSQSN